MMWKVAQPQTMAVQRCFRLSIPANTTARRANQSMATSPPRRTITVGILQETYHPWERRAPLTPTQVHTLLQQYNTQLKILVQPSSLRAFANQDYQQAGATITPNLENANIILGVKRPSEEHTLLPNKCYAFFSHTVKGQTENLPLLRTCLARNIQLLDYERILQEDGHRFVSFGRYAGIAGALDGLHGLGQCLLYRHQRATPLLTLPRAIWHTSLQQSLDQLQQAVEEWKDALPEPLVMTITGKGGSVHEGVMSVLEQLPHETVTVNELPELWKNPTQSGLYLCPVGTADVMRHKDANKTFDRQDYAAHPSQYESIFASHIAPYTQAVWNCIYWDARYPRLMTKRDARKLWEEGKDRLLLLADLSCDVNGSMEFLERSTTIERPYFHYDPLLERETYDGVNSHNNSGIVVLGVDILPTELPRESSDHFGKKVIQVVRELIEGYQASTQSALDISHLRPGLANGFITTPQGTLTEAYRYLDRMMRDAPVLPAQHTLSLLIEGHLFDSNLINQILDVVEKHGCGLQFGDCNFPWNSKASGPMMSSMVLKISAPDLALLGKLEDKIITLSKVIERAEATVKRIEPKVSKAASPPSSLPKEAPHGENWKSEHVLVLGAGRVAKSLVEYLGRKQNRSILVASDKEEEARAVAAAAKGGSYITFDVAHDIKRMTALIKDADLVVSLLPAPMHPMVASECISLRKNLVTASYESEEMRKMNSYIKEAGILILNEVGLDPGLDHMSAMKIIDDIRDRDGNITYFTSVCGGLPAPEAANNPLKYKFSWSPKGVIRASQNPARFRWEGRVMEILDRQLLLAAAPFMDAWPNLHLECLPNRDSLHYEDVYGIQGIQTLFRGTLRYRGFSSLMNIFQNMGLFDSTDSHGDNWVELLSYLQIRFGGFESLEDFIEACADEDMDEARRAMECLRWLGATSRNEKVTAKSVVDAFCDLLEKKLAFEKDERDMVAMHHTIKAVFPDGTEEHHNSSLMVFGDESMSAMAKTVGYTTGAAVELVLGGSLANETGLLLPTDRRVYLPVLEAVAAEGIAFEESHTYTHHEERLHT